MHEIALSDLSQEQLYLYYNLIINDKNEEAKNSLELIEYLASFWSPEAVRKVKDMRNNKKETKQDEFEDLILNNKFKSNKYIEAISKIKEANNQTLKETSNKYKLPTDLSKLK